MAGIQHPCQSHAANEFYDSFILHASWARGLMNRRYIKGCGISARGAYEFAYLVTLLPDSVVSIASNAPSQ